ncbi:hypothetical protein FGO68_gene14445 [Halteria grandinella]|uniref:non-specific serine/threonine protein kinase n=1 Tax=Halteria grandinella TaxID=5974 RepID=A0A8J8T3X5_HALGN|nr:hypothetical protein FGO68_gene14445 [Halteria grandinella]
MKILNELESDSQDIWELEFLRITDHPFILGYIEDFAFPQDFAGRHCIVLENADGCDLRKKMQALEYDIPEKVALNWFTHVCLALAKMHYKGLAHRDLKPDNILIVGEIAGGIAKLSNFGNVRSLDMDSHITDKIGTALYFAPEKQTKKFQGGVDVWALGIVLYQLLCNGDFPFNFNFQGKSQDEYLAALPTLTLKQMPAHVSDSCKALIQKMLQKNPENRPTIFDILQTPIITEKIRLIADEYVIGIDIAKRIKQQMIDLEIQLCQIPSQNAKIKEVVQIIENKKITPQIEEKKELAPLPFSDNLTAPSSIPSSTPSDTTEWEDMQKMSIQSSNLFQQKMLDRLIDTINKPINWFIPVLNKK